jgi:hypothetical protein
MTETCISKVSRQRGVRCSHAGGIEATDRDGGFVAGRLGEGGVCSSSVLAGLED